MHTTTGRPTPTHAAHTHHWLDITACPSPTLAYPIVARACAHGGEAAEALQYGGTGLRATGTNYLVRCGTHDYTCECVRVGTRNASGWDGDDAHDWHRGGGCHDGAHNYMHDCYEDGPGDYDCAHTCDGACTDGCRFYVRCEHHAYDDYA